MAQDGAFVQPSQHRSLRACMVCAIVQTSSTFFNQGCPNCDEFLNIKGGSEAINDCTSQVFEGLITIADPPTSWVAKWLRLDKYVPGVYATKVVGILAEDLIAQVEEVGGLRYKPRDGTEEEEAV